MNISRILDMIRRQHGSVAELRSAKAASIADRQVAERKVANLELQHKKALLEQDDSEVDKIEANLRLDNRAIERHLAAERELDGLIALAEQKEKEEKINSAAQAAQMAQRQLLADMVELDGLATRIGTILNKANDLYATLKINNDYCKSNGRADLVVVSPMSLLRNHLGLATDSHMLPQYRDWQLDGYHPLRRTHTLERARDLLN